MLEPESIRTAKTKAIDETWAERLSVMRYRQLLINFETEPNIEKLELWLEMFGLDPEMLKQGLTTDEYRLILQNIILIFRLSGTAKSIELIAQALGATSTRPIYKYVLYYNGEITYGGDYFYDSGGVYRLSAITIEATGVAAENQESFVMKMRKLFELFEPMWIYLEGIDFI